MREAIISQKNQSSIEWDEDYFKYCEFADLDLGAKVATSDFLSCTFSNIECYWVLFILANFISCRFTDCVFRGCTFDSARFVDCEFTRCQFVKDNLGGDCTFDETISYGNRFIETTGFPVTHS